MKKLLIVPVICAVLVGCSNAKYDKDATTAWTLHGYDCATRIVKIEGHKYVLMDGYYSGAIIHAASCDCMNP